VVVGLIIPLGQSSYASPSVSGGTGGITGTAQVSHSPGTDPGSVGWQVQDTEGPNANRQASLSYRAPLVMVQASANESRTSRTGTLDLTGAIATMGRGIFVANRIDDAFAVVDAGAPGVEVSYENRPVGRTDSHGMLLVPTLRSSAQNRLSLDPVAMPVDTEIETTREVVTPADRSGVLVSFKVHSDATAALVIFARPDGGFMPAGSTGHLDGRPETFIIGYDGQSFLKGLAGSNQVTIDFGDGTCHASFAFKPQPGKQVKIGPVPCR
jgi:outer membrane usher protein